MIVSGGGVFVTGKLVVLKRQLITSVEYTQCTICYIRDLFESFLVCVIRVSDLVRCFYLGKILY